MPAEVPHQVGDGSNGQGASTPGREPSSIYKRYPLPDFKPPSYNEWISLTDLTGRVYGTKARGVELQAVDRAYKEWIKDTSNPIATDALNTVLLKYAGLGYLSFGGTAIQSHTDRNKNHLFENLLALLALPKGSTYAAQLDGMSKIQQDAARKTRRRLLTLMGNIDLQWDWQTDLLGGLPLALPVGEVTGLTNAIKSSPAAMVIAGTTAVAYGVYQTDLTAEHSQDSGLRAVWEKFKAFLKLIFEKFTQWASDKLSKLLKCDPVEIIGTLSTILSVIFSYLLKKAVPFVGAAKDVMTGGVQFFENAWIQTELKAAEEKLVTREGSFALIADGIKSGIARRQAVAAWTMAKGAVNIAAALTGAALISLVLGALEFGLKIVFNILEHRAIKSFLEQAKTMFKRIINGHNTIRLRDFDPLEIKGPAPAGYMPQFRAWAYTPDDFLENKNAAYLNFLHSAAQASPVLSAVMMNSGIVSGSKDVFHVATPHTESDDEVASEYVKALSHEAKRLYEESSFRVIPALVTNFQDTEYNEGFQEMLNNAKNVPQPKPIVLTS